MSKKCLTYIFLYVAVAHFLAMTYPVFFLQLLLCLTTALQFFCI